MERTTMQARGQTSVFEIVGNVARPLVPIKSPEDAAKWYESANMSITQSATQALGDIRKQASVRAMVLAGTTVVGGFVALYLAWQIALGVAGLGVASLGVLGLTWLYFKKDSLISRWRIEREVSIIKLAALRDRMVLAAKQDALDALKAQAAKNPIATRQLQAEVRRGIIQSANQRAASLKGKTERAAAALAVYNQKYSSRPLPEMQQQVDFYRGQYDEIVRLTNQSTEDLNAFVAETELMETQLAMAADGKELAEFLGASGVNQERDRILRNFATSQALTQSQQSIALLQSALSTDNVTGKF